jgi:hypothetical protein
VKLGRLIFPEVMVDIVLILNVELLLKSYDPEFLRLVLESNERGKEEIKNEDVRREAEKVRADALKK